MSVYVSMRQRLRLSACMCVCVCTGVHADAHQPLWPEPLRNHRPRVHLWMHFSGAKALLGKQHCWKVAPELTNGRVGGTVCRCLP